MLSPEQIIANYESIKNLVSIKVVDPDKKEKILKLLTDLDERLAMCPASGKQFNAFPGGLLAHKLKVIEILEIMVKFWKKFGDTKPYTEEELYVSAILYNLGKVGSKDKDLYVQSTNEWRIKNLHEVYVMNPEISFMNIADRTLFLIQQYGINLTESEYLAIKMYNGMFDESNKTYYSENKQAMGSYLPFMLHQADFMASVLASNI